MRFEPLRISGRRRQATAAPQRNRAMGAGRQRITPTSCGPTRRSLKEITRTPKFIASLFP